MSEQDYDDNIHTSMLEQSRPYVLLQTRPELHKGEDLTLQSPKAKPRPFANTPAPTHLKVMGAIHGGWFNLKFACVLAGVVKEIFCPHI